MPLTFKLSFLVTLSAGVAFAQAAPVTLSIAVGELTSPLVIAIDQPVALTLKQSRPRPVTIWALGVNVSTRREKNAAILNLAEDFDEPLQVSFRNGRPSEFDRVPRAVVVTDASTVDSPPLVVGRLENAPKEQSVGERLVERSLAFRSVAFYPEYREQGSGPQTFRPTVDLDALWVTIPEEFIVYSDAAKCDLSVEDGEPLLVVSYNSGATVTVARVNGQTGDCRKEAFDALSPTKPSKVRVPAPKVEVRSPTEFFEEEPFLDGKASDPRVTKYTAKKAKVEACAAKVRASIDPDGRAGRYDLVTTDAKGNTKVEAFRNTVWRKVDAQCKLKDLATDRANLYESIKAELVAVQQRRIDTLVARLGRPLGTSARPLNKAKDEDL